MRKISCPHSPRSVIDMRNQEGIRELFKQEKQDVPTTYEWSIAVSRRLVNASFVQAQKAWNCA